MRSSRRPCKSLPLHLSLARRHHHRLLHLRWYLSYVLQRQSASYLRHKPKGNKTSSSSSKYRLRGSKLPTILHRTLPRAVPRLPLVAPPWTRRQVQRPHSHQRSGRVLRIRIQSSAGIWAPLSWWISIQKFAMLPSRETSCVPTLVRT